MPVEWEGPHSRSGAAADYPHDPECVCSHAVRPLGHLHGVSMGRGTVRLSTTPGCPVHDTCRGYSKTARAAHDQGYWLWCPIHGARDCPLVSSN